jgi:hypothetical protein
MIFTVILLSTCLQVAATLLILYDIRKSNKTLNLLLAGLFMTMTFRRLTSSWYLFQGKDLPLFPEYIATLVSVLCIASAFVIHRESLITEFGKKAIEIIQPVVQQHPSFLYKKESLEGVQAQLVDILCELEKTTNSMHSSLPSSSSSTSTSKEEV